MNIEALALLETPTARKLVATWPQVEDYAGLSPSKDLVKNLTALLGKWSRVSGVHPKICGKWLTPLLTNDIIKPDGTIDRTAAEYIATCALSRAKFATERGRKHDA